MVSMCSIVKKKPKNESILSRTVWLWNLSIYEKAPKQFFLDQNIVFVIIQVGAGLGFLAYNILSFAVLGLVCNILACGVIDVHPPIVVCKCGYTGGK